MLEIDFVGRPVEGSIIPAPIREFRRRRPTWRAGTRVVLSDGAWWWLPPLDLALVASCPSFRRDVNTALRLAHLIDEEPVGERDALFRSAVYHAQMVQMGVTLLQQNYELDHDQWFGLIAFPQLDGTFRLSRGVAEVFAAAATIWLPLLVDGRLVV